MSPLPCYDGVMRINKNHSWFRAKTPIQYISDYGSGLLHIIVVGAKSFSYDLGKRLHTDSLSLAEFLMIDRDEESYDLAFIPNVDVVTNEKRCVLMFVDMKVDMSINKLSSFLSQLKRVDIPVILYASAGEYLSMAYGSTQQEKFNQVKTLALSLRESLFALFLLPTEVTGGLCVTGEINAVYEHDGVKHQFYPCPAHSLLFVHSWYKTVSKEASLYSEVSYFIIQDILLKKDTFQEDVPLITDDYIRTVTQQAIPPTLNILHILGSNELTLGQANNIVKSAFEDHNNTKTLIALNAEEALDDKIVLMFAFGYPFEKAVSIPTICSRE